MSCRLELTKDEMAALLALLIRATEATTKMLKEGHIEPREHPEAAMAVANKLYAEALRVSEGR